MKRHMLFALCAVALTASGCERKGAKEPSTTNDKTQGADEDVTKKIQTVAVAGNVHMLIGKGGNIGVSAGEDGILIIDDQFAPLADKIRAALGEINKGDLKYVLNTHHHGDHTGGNPVFGKEATIIAHDNVRKRLVEADKPKEGWPVLTYDKTVTLHFNGEPIRVLHFPTGHTDGDSIIVFENSNVVHMGDHFFNGRFPFVDLNSGGTVKGYQDNVFQVIGMVKPDVKIIPGHGPLATLDDLKGFHNMMTETIAAVKPHVDAGKSLQEIQKAGLDPKWKEWGTGFISTERWIEDAV